MMGSNGDGAIADDMEYMDFWEDWLHEHAEPIYENGQLVGWAYPNGTVTYEVETTFTEE